MKLSIFPVAALAFTMLVGCVSQKQYDELQARYNTAYAEGQAAQNELSAARARIEGLESMIEAERRNLKSLETAFQTCQSSLNNCLDGKKGDAVNISKLLDEIAASNKYIQHLVNTKSKSDSLNMVLTNNLTRSLSREEMRDIDVQVLKGVVYISLADNMLYKSGSYEISPAAGETLSKIAKIIKDYRDYDVLIEGNTDNVPINRPNIRNNWDLSALRASSVVQALQNQYGVDPKRLTAGGRGEYNPVTTNATEEGRSKNRRTQIIITPKLDEFMNLIGQAPGKK
ncbi:MULTISPECIES: OmpA family protein [Weeksella]|uniref:OmpA/MotB family protein n=1 Tax=Weeksella TaxID=1013 RepID=UPI0008A1EC4D|nr:MULTISPECIES: OmpA family protein [Weeksella]MDK7375555.1 OmpA family protein [Weeksella virosa]MDK7674941.1 OmpA family protein [Weeksella virosa]OFM84201.1 hypothetical protein HMPREF2660_09310 [Weeksella sp. HMSC059D05]